MDRVEKYREIVRRIMQEASAERPSLKDVEVELICDDSLGHYELSYTGWSRSGRIHGSIIHIDIRGDKVWVQYDGTDLEIAQQLLDAGIPHDHIVLGFHPPEARHLTPFAVA